MRKNFIFVTGLSLYFLFAANTAVAKYVVPAEWEDQESVWYAWPVFEPLAGHSNIPQVTTMITLLTNSPSKEKVDLVVKGQTEQIAAIQALTAAGADLSKVRFRQIPHTDFWMRDYLLFLRDTNTNALGVAGFGFNAWGFGSASNYFNSISSTDGVIDEKIASQLGTEFIPANVTTDPTDHRVITMEEGGLEFNGSGDLIVSEAVILQRERNPGLKKAEVEAALKRIFSLNRVIWLPKFRYNSATQKEEVIPESDPAFYASGGRGGIVSDDSPFYGPLPNPQPAWFRPPAFRSSAYDIALTPLTTNGHTDEYVRWVSSDTVLLASVDRSEVQGLPPDDLKVRTKQRLDMIKSVLQSYNVKVVSMPTANDKVFYSDGGGTYGGLADMVNTLSSTKSYLLDYFPANLPVPILSARSYLNYLLTNDYVFIQSYGSEDGSEDVAGLNKLTSAQKDETAKAMFETYFGRSSKNQTRKVRQIVVIPHMDYVNAGGGGIHCISQQMPLGIHN